MDQILYDKISAHYLPYNCIFFSFFLICVNLEWAFNVHFFYLWLGWWQTMWFITTVKFNDPHVLNHHEKAIARLSRDSALCIGFFTLIPSHSRSDPHTRTRTLTYVSTSFPNSLNTCTSFLSKLRHNNAFLLLNSPPRSPVRLLTHSSSYFRWIRPIPNAHGVRAGSAEKRNGKFSLLLHPSHLPIRLLSITSLHILTVAHIEP